MTREQVNPDMIIKKGSMGGAPFADEKAPAKMPQVGTMPTGKKAAKKATPAMG